MGLCWVVLLVLCGFAGSAVFEKGGCIPPSVGSPDCARKLAHRGGSLQRPAHKESSLRLRGGSNDGPTPMEIDDDSVPVPPGETKSGLRQRPAALGIPGRNPLLADVLDDLEATGPTKRAVRIKWKTRTFDLEIDLEAPTAVLKEKLCNITQVLPFKPHPNPAPISISLLSRRSRWTVSTPRVVATPEAMIPHQPSRCAGRLRREQHNLIPSSLALKELIRAPH